MILKNTMVLSERQRIEILILLGSGDNKRTQGKVCDLFNAKYPENQILQGTVSKIFNKFEGRGRVHDLPKSGRTVALDDDKKLDITLQITRTTIQRFLRKEVYRIRYALFKSFWKTTVIGV